MRFKATLTLSGGLPLACAQSAIVWTIPLNATSVSEYVRASLVVTTTIWNATTTVYATPSSVSNSTSTLLDLCTSTLIADNTSSPLDELTSTTTVQIPTTTTITLTTHIATKIVTATITALALPAKTQLPSASSQPSFPLKDCSPIPAGLGPPAICHGPETPTCFLTSPAFTHFGLTAPVPQNFTPAFTNLHASVTSPTYLEYHELSSYNTTACAQHCDRVSTCQSFNIYFERAPLARLGPGCRNARHSTVVKCSLWGGGIGREAARNTGETVWDFKVVIAGSNGYNREGVEAERLESRVESAGGKEREGRRLWWIAVGLGVVAGVFGGL